MFPPRALNDFVSFRLLRPAMEWGRGQTRQGRRAYRAYREGLRFRQAAAGWSAEQRSAWVLARLREMLRYAQETTAYYRRIWKAVGFDPRADFTFADFSGLPVLTRADLHEFGAEMRSTAVAQEEGVRNATGGSTGRPVEIWMGPAERGWRASGSEYSMRRLGVGQGMRRGLLWGHHLDPISRDSLRDRVADLLANRRWYECLRLSPERFEQYDRDLRRYAPHCIVAYASSLAQFADYLEARGGPAPTYPLRCFITGAEKLYDVQRAQIQRVFDRPVHERYGARDVGDMGFQYLEGGSLHFDVDWADLLVEPQELKSEAPILVTKLHGDGMPMIRYVNDDLAVFPAGSRPGYPAWRLEAILGRRADRILLPGGGAVHGLHFPHLLKDYPLRDFRVHQAADYSVTVQLVPGAEWSAASQNGLAANLASNLRGVPFTIELVDEIPRNRANKWRPVTSEISGVPQ